MKSPVNYIHIKRNSMSVLLLFKMPTPNDQQNITELTYFRDSLIISNFLQIFFIRN